MVESCLVNWTAVCSQRRWALLSGWQVDAIKPWPSLPTSSWMGSMHWHGHMIDASNAFICISAEYLAIVNFYLIFSKSWWWEIWSNSIPYSFCVFLILFEKGRYPSSIWTGLVTWKPKDFPKRENSQTFPKEERSGQQSACLLPQQPHLFFMTPY